MNITSCTSVGGVPQVNLGSTTFSQPFGLVAKAAQRLTLSVVTLNILHCAAVSLLILC